MQGAPQLMRVNEDGISGGLIALVEMSVMGKQILQKDGPERVYPGWTLDYQRASCEN